MKDMVNRAGSFTSSADHETGASVAPPASTDDDDLRKLVESLQIGIAIVGCGGGGSNTVNRLTAAGVAGAKVVAANSDARHLLTVKVPHKIILGKVSTKGLGAGAIPEVGRSAAEEARDELMAHIEGNRVVFVTAGMGGGTGTGSAPYVAELARRVGALTIGVVTMPFKAEGRLRMENAKKGLLKLHENCDTTIIIHNEQLLKLVPKLPLEAAFRVADETLMHGIKGITEIITKPGLVNVDFNDINTIMRNGGVAMIGMGESAEGRDRVPNAVQEALSSPLLGDFDMSSAEGCLVRVQGGPDLTVGEAEMAAEMISSKLNSRARIIWGCSIEPELEGRVSLLVVITGVKTPLIP
ncbi:MAG: cell division protein FtsZ [Methanomassiliicoccus sp.]|nr:cell division protein FtsZ [Methanomassiliicoccus sp.]